VPAEIEVDDEEEEDEEDELDTQAQQMTVVTPSDLLYRPEFDLHDDDGSPQIDPALMTLAQPQLAAKRQTPAVAPAPSDIAVTTPRDHPTVTTPASTPLVPTDRHLQKQVRQNEADILWASSGDAELTRRFLAADLEEQVDLLDELWQPENDEAIHLASEAEYAALAKRVGRTVDEVRARQEYLVKNRRKTRLPIGAQRWPFCTEA
jgi:hypothetical protein